MGAGTERAPHPAHAGPTEREIFVAKVHNPLSKARRERTRANTALEKVDLQYAKDRARALRRVGDAEAEVERLEKAEQAEREAEQNGGAQ